MVELEDDRAMAPISRTLYGIESFRFAASHARESIASLTLLDYSRVTDFEEPRAPTDNSQEELWFDSP